MQLKNLTVLITGASSGIGAASAQVFAEAVLFCATRPPHANVREMILMPTDQAAAVHAHRQDHSPAAS